MFSKKIKIALILLFATSLILTTLVPQPVYAVFTTSPIIKTNAKIYINNTKSTIKYIGIKNDIAYIPINKLTKSLGFKYSYRNKIATFNKNGTALKIDFKTKKTYVNNKSSSLYCGICKRTINNKLYIFVSTIDLQRIFKITSKTNISEKTVKLNTNFGLMDINIASSSFEKSEATINKNINTLFKFTNKFATKSNGIINKNFSEEASNTINKLCDTLTYEFTNEDYNGGIMLRDLDLNSLDNPTINYLAQIRYLVSLTHLNISPEIIRTYEIYVNEFTLYTSAFYFNIEGLEMSNTDLSLIAIETIETLPEVTLTAYDRKKITENITNIANKLRKERKTLLTVDLNNLIIYGDII